MTRTPMSAPSLPEVLARTGATYRQLDYWIRRGWLDVPFERGYSGSGSPRAWTDDEITVARRMVAYIAAGLPPETAHHVARHDGWLPNGVFRVVEPELEIPENGEEG